MARREKIQSELDEFLSLPHNWDSYDADPPPAKTVDAARHLIARLADNELPRLVAPIPDGVYFSWGRGEQFIATIDPSDTWGYLQQFTDGNYCEEDGVSEEIVLQHLRDYHREQDGPQSPTG